MMTIAILEIHKRVPENLCLQNTVKKDTSKSGQTSLATAGTNFTKPRKKTKFGPSDSTYGTI